MNKNELISYNNYYFDKYEYSQIGIGPNSLHVDQPANDIEKFFFKSTTCPFCGTILKEVFHGSQSDSIGTDLYMSGEVLECPTCSWRTYKTHFCDSCYSNGSYHAICTDTRHYAIAKKFNIDDKTIPLNVLKHELQNHKNLLYDINPYKLEDLCQDILNMLRHQIQSFYLQILQQIYMYLIPLQQKNSWNAYPEFLYILNR